MIWANVWMLTLRSKPAIVLKASATDIGACKIFDAKRESRTFSLQHLNFRYWENKFLLTNLSKDPDPNG